MRCLCEVSAIQWVQSSGSNHPLKISSLWQAINKHTQHDKLEESMQRFWPSVQQADNAGCRNNSYITSRESTFTAHLNWPFILLWRYIPINKNFFPFYVHPGLLHFFHFLKCLLRILCLVHAFFVPCIRYKELDIVVCKMIYSIVFWTIGDNNYIITNNLNK